MKTIRTGLVCALFVVSFCMLAGTATGQATMSARGGGAYDSWGSAYDMSAQVAAELGYSFPVGPFTVRPHFGLWAGYDDNVYLDEEEEVDDVFITLAPGLMVIYGNPSHNYVSVNYTLELPRYIDEDRANYESHHLSTDLHYESAKHTYHIGDRFMQTEVKDIEIGERVEKTQNVLSADIERMMSSKTSVGIQGLHEIHDYKDDSYIDYYEYRVGGRLYYRIRPKTDIFVDAGYGWVDLDPLPDDEATADLDLPAGYSSSYGDAEYQEVSVGVRGKVSGKTVMTGRVGFHRREFDDDIETIDDWVASLDTLTRFSSRFQGGFEVSRRLFPWLTVPGNTSVSTTLNPYIRYQLWRNRISLSGSVAYSIVEFYDAEGEQDREDKYWEYVGIVDWKSSKLVTLGIGYAYSEQESNRSGAESENGRIIARAMFNY